MHKCVCKFNFWVTGFRIFFNVFVIIKKKKKKKKECVTKRKKNVKCSESGGY